VLDLFCNDGIEFGRNFRWDRCFAGLCDSRNDEAVIILNLGNGGWVRGCGGNGI